MPKNNEAKILLDRKSRKEWYEKILETINMRPLTFDALAEEFGYPDRGTPENLALSVIVSALQAWGPNKEPKIKSATVEGEYVYPLYRTDQEVKLIAEGILSKKEHSADLTPYMPEHRHRHNTDLVSELRNLSLQAGGKER